jgi:hypothetical protein
MRPLKRVDRIDANDPEPTSAHGSTARPDPMRAHFQCASLIER